MLDFLKLASMEDFDRFGVDSGFGLQWLLKMAEWLCIKDWSWNGLEGVEGWMAKMQGEEKA